MREIKTLDWHDGVRDREIGLRIRARRREMRLTLEKLADRIGISYEQFRRYEVGLHAIRASALERIAAELEVPVAHFYQPTSETPNAAAANEVIDLARRIGAIKDAAVRSALFRLVERVSINETTIFIEID